MKRLSFRDLGIKLFAVVVSFTIATMLMDKFNQSAHRHSSSPTTSVLSNYADTDVDPGPLAGTTDDTVSDATSDDAYDDTVSDDTASDDSSDDAYDDADADDQSWDSTDDTVADEPEDLDDDFVSDDTTADDTSSDDTSAGDTTTNDWAAILPGNWIAPQSYGGEEYWNFNPRIPSVVKQYCARGCFSMSPVDTGVPGGMFAGTYSVNGTTLVVQFPTSQYVYENLRGVSSSCFAADFGGEAITFCRPA